MENVILIGFGPDATKSLERSAFSLRTYMFEKGLEDAGFQVEKFMFSRAKHKDCFNINSLSDRTKVKLLVETSSTSVVIGTGFEICKIISEWKLRNKFIVSDLNGWTPSEIQARSFSEKSNVLVERFKHAEKQILESSDFITTVSNAQKFAVYGELSMLGRLRHENFDKVLVSAISNKGVKFRNNDEISERSDLLDSKKFKILWLGGFNNWADEKTLFEGVEKIMDKYSFVELVVTGGAINGVNDSKYPVFEQLVQNSVHKDKFTLMNWAKAVDVPRIISECQVGLNCDLYCLETLTGARNRINELITNGLPVISSRGSEVADFISSKKLGSTFESQNVNDLAFQMELAINGQAKIWKNNCLGFQDDYSDFRQLIDFCKHPFKISYKKQSGISKLIWYFQNKSLRDLLRKLGL